MISCCSGSPPQETQLFPDEIDLFPSSKKQGHGLQSTDGRFNLLQTHDRQECSLKLPNSHSSGQLCLPALTAVCVNGVFGVGSRGALPCLSHINELPVIQRIFRSQGPYPQGFVRRKGERSPSKKQATGKDSCERSKIHLQLSSNSCALSSNHCARSRMASFCKLGYCNVDGLAKELLKHLLVFHGDSNSFCL